MINSLNSLEPAYRSHCQPFRPRRRIPAAKAKDLAQRALRGLAGFAKSLKLKFEDIEVGFDFEPEPGLADNGDLEHDLQALLEAAGAAAQQADSALVIFVDELQYVEEGQRVRRCALPRANNRWSSPSHHLADFARRKLFPCALRSPHAG